MINAPKNGDQMDEQEELQRLRVYRIRADELMARLSKVLQKTQATNVKRISIHVHYKLYEEMQSLADAEGMLIKDWVAQKAREAVLCRKRTYTVPTLQMLQP